MEAVMVKLENSKLDRLLDDISMMKDAINKNKSILSKVLHPIYFRIVSFYATIIFTVFPIILYYIKTYFGSYYAIPTIIWTIFLTLIAINILIMSFIKIKNFKKAFHNVHENFSIKKLIYEVVAAHAIHIYIPIILILAFLLTYFIIIKNVLFILPTLCFGFGLIFNIIGNITNLKQYLLMGYWFILSGIFIILLPAISFIVLIPIVFGGGFLLFALSSFKCKFSKNTEE